MLRGYLIYFVMFVALGVGLWAVLSVGAGLQAPAEIAGTWHVRWETTSPTGSGYHGTMKIEQSGRYCTFRFDGTRTISLKMVAGTALGQADPQLPVARLVGGDYHMTLQRTANRDELRLEISGRDHFRGFADRVTRPAESASGSSSTLPPVADARP